MSREKIFVCLFLDRTPVQHTKVTQPWLATHSGHPDRQPWLMCVALLEFTHGRMMHPKLKWLIVAQLLLCEQAVCRSPLPPAHEDRLLLKPHVTGENHSGEVEQALPASLNQPRLPPRMEKEDEGVLGQEKISREKAVLVEERVQSSQRLVASLREKLQARVNSQILLQGNASCKELLSASTLGDPSSGLFPRELLSLSLVPVLVVAGCQQDAQTLVLGLYSLLGVEDTEELLMQVQALMGRTARPPASPAPSPSKEQAEPHLQALMFNIQQLARAGGTARGRQALHCQGWSRVNGTLLLGTVVEVGRGGGLGEALQACEHLGAQCSGVSRSDREHSGRYQVVLMQDSRAVPSAHSDCWIRQCADASRLAEQRPGEERKLGWGQRIRRSALRACVNKKEERVYRVVEWIPAVSTLYNLGTAVYYASVNCSDLAKERAILSAVDLGTDALMAVTGGTAGVAGYALGAGVKTGLKAGIKYMLNSMKQEDLMVNQSNWEEGVFTIE